MLENQPAARFYSTPAVQRDDVKVTLAAAARTHTRSVGARARQHQIAAPIYALRRPLLRAIFAAALFHTHPAEILRAPLIGPFPSTGLSTEFRSPSVRTAASKTDQRTFRRRRRPHRPQNERRFRPVNRSADGMHRKMTDPLHNYSLVFGRNAQQNAIANHHL